LQIKSQKPSAKITLALHGRLTKRRPHDRTQEDRTVTGLWLGLGCWRRLAV